MSSTKYSPRMFAILTILLFGAFPIAFSWVLPVLRHSQTTSKTRHCRSFAIHSYSNDFFDCPDEEECEINWGIMPGYEAESTDSQPDTVLQDDPDCPEEEECEIDWSQMPGFEDEEAPEESSEGTVVTNTTGSSIANAASKDDHHLIGDEQDELEPQEAYVPRVERSVETSRKIFEMNWQIENCKVDEDQCTDFCEECSGSGKQWCKFCRGTGMTAFLSEFRPCVLCQEGRVDCSDCAGTGSISPWAKTHDKGV